MNQTPYLLGIPFLDAQDIVLEVRREVETRRVVRTVVLDDEDTVFVVELTEVDSVLVIVDAQHVWIEPHLASAERRTAFLLEGDRLDVEFREHVAACGTRLDG